MHYRFDGAVGSSSEWREYFQECSGMENQPFLGIDRFTHDTTILRTYFGLPPHQWGWLKFQYAAVDNWQGDGLIVTKEEGNNPEISSF